MLVGMLRIRMSLLILLGVVILPGCLDPCHTCSSTSLKTFFAKTKTSMTQGRFAHTASLLPNGNVFVAGGAINVAVNSSAELYRPSTGQFVSTNETMTQSRVFHTATLLPNGEVLLAGGRAGKILNSAELYNPTNQIFSASAMTMNAPRTSHTATLLQTGPNAGMVLLAGGSRTLTPIYLRDKGALDTAEFYDPVHDTFTPTTSKMIAARSEHTATLLGDGSVLIAGGMSNEGTALASAEMFVPSSGAFMRTTAGMGTPRREHAATLISACMCAVDGQVLITGGQDNSGHALASAELFDPTTGKFTPAAKMAAARFLHTATSFGNGKVLIGGGDFPEDAELYDVATGTSQLLSNGMNDPTGAGNAAAVLQNGQILVTGGSEPPDPKAGFTDVNLNSTLFASDKSFAGSGSMATRRVGHTATTLGDGTVLIAGGETPRFLVQSSTELFVPSTLSFSVGPSLNTGRFEHTATPINGAAQVLIAGGVEMIPASILKLKSTATAELYDAASNAFISTGSMNTARDGATGSLIKGCGCAAEGMVLIAGGAADPLKIAGMRNAEIYDPVRRMFSPTVVNMVDSRAFQSAAVLSNGMVLLVGGKDQNGALQATAEIFDPTRLTFGATASRPHFRYFNAPAAVLNDGNVLLNDGNGNAELYKPTTSEFVVTGTPTYLPSGRFTATVLVNQEVLFAGGFDKSGGLAGGNPATADTELYNPSKGTFDIFGSLEEARDAHTATSLSDGSVLITGGEASLAATISSAELLPASAIPVATPTPGQERKQSLQADNEQHNPIAETTPDFMVETSTETREERLQRAEQMMQHELEIRQLVSPDS